MSGLSLLLPRVQDRDVGVVTTGSGPVGEASYQRRSVRWGLLFSAVWLVFLVEPLQRAWALRGQPAGWVGMAATLVFVGVYLVVFATVRRGLASTAPRPNVARAWSVLALLVALAVIMVLALGPSGVAAAYYVGVVAVVLLPEQQMMGVVGCLVVGTAVLARQPGFAEVEGDWLGVVLASFAMWGVTLLMRRNAQLLRARAENERLVLEAERHRMARDLHDILGHSLTVITVKSELAGAMLDAGSPAALQRARAEVADLERLARDALADVRATAHGYRDVSLPGELARAAEALRAAGIEAHLPSAADAVPTELRELFAWTVREGVTNVVRHSGAQRCEVVLEPDRVLVRDDGAGSGGAGCDDGAGLVGLRERASARGARVTAERDGRGFVLEVLA